MPGPHACGAPTGEWLACLGAPAAELASRGRTTYITTALGPPARLFVRHLHDQAGHSRSNFK